MVAWAAVETGAAMTDATDWPKCSDNPTFGGLIPTEEFCWLIWKLKISTPAILDAGACDGRDSLAFRSAFPCARVVAVEGLAENYSRWLLPLANKIEIHHRILAGKTGSAKFHVKQTNGIHGIYDRGIQYGDRERAVDAISLDDFCDEIKLQPTVLKIDCEGATYDILAGGQEALRSVRAICFESESVEFFKGQKLHGHVSSLLGRLGFQKHLRRSGPFIRSPSGEYGRQYESIWVRS